MSVSFRPSCVVEWRAGGGNQEKRSISLFVITSVTLVNNTYLRSLPKKMEVLPDKKKKKKSVDPTLV